MSGLGFEPKTAGIHYRILVGLAAMFDDCTGWCESVLTLFSNEKVIHDVFGENGF